MKKNEYKAALITLNEIFRTDTWKNLFKKKSSQGLHNRKCRGGKENLQAIQTQGNSLLYDFY